MDGAALLPKGRFVVTWAEYNPYSKDDPLSSGMLGTDSAISFPTREAALRRDMHKEYMNILNTIHHVSEKVSDNVPGPELSKIIPYIPFGFRVLLEDEIDGVEPNVALIGKDGGGRWCIKGLITERDARDAKEKQENKMYEVTVALKKVVSVSAENKEKASEYALKAMKEKFFDKNEYSENCQIAVLSVEEWAKR